MSTGAYANDTLAVLGVGGLELATSEHIAIVSENLYLSASEVRVRYEFRNDSDQDIISKVASTVSESRRLSRWQEEKS